MMNAITDDYMREHLQQTKQYTVMLLHRTAKYSVTPDKDRIIWEHVRRNFQLRQAGKMCIVCPVSDATDVAGVSVFITDEEETRKIMEGDPAVMAGILRFETHQSRSFPGDSLTI